jgi:hypothetical protein
LCEAGYAERRPQQVAARLERRLLPLFIAGDVGRSLTAEIRNPNLEVPNNYESTKHEIQNRLPRLEHCGFEFVSDFSGTP